MTDADKPDTSNAIRIVLVGTSHPGNIGAAARAMKTMGLGELALVAPRQFPCAEATARAAGADDILAQARVHEHLADAVADCALVLGTTARPRHLEWPELSPRQAAAEVVRIRAPVAVVFGRERSGLSNDELDCCSAFIRIPTATRFSSLNLAAAVQVMAYELLLAASSPASESVAPEPIPHREMEGFYRHLDDVLVQLAFLDPASPKFLQRRLRRLFNRARPD